MIAIEEHVGKYKTSEEVAKHTGEIKVTAKDFDKALEKAKPSGQETKKDYGKIV